MKTVWGLILAMGMSITAGAQGPLAPTNAPGPGMHTLEELFQSQQAIQLQVASLQAWLSASGVMLVSGNMVLIPAGSFAMGDNATVGQEVISYAEPQHTVSVSAFYIDKYEVTGSLWAQVSGWATAHGYGFGSNVTSKAATHPEMTLNWFDALAWCNARSQLDGFIPCYLNGDGTVYTNSKVLAFSGTCNWSASGYRLPTEAEWEKAARGGVANHRFPWGDANTIQHARANYTAYPALYAYDTSPTSGLNPAYTNGALPYTSAVGAFSPNGYGLYDMAGNVWEWCWDWFGGSYYSDSPLVDPHGPSLGVYHICRGGAWSSNADSARVAVRGWLTPSSANSATGLRCVRTP